MTNAYLSVKHTGLSVKRAATQYRVPVITVRDKILGEIDAEWVKTGRPPKFTLEDEAKIVDHLKVVASYGYR